MQLDFFPEDELEGNSDSTQTSVCIACNEEKPLSEYYHYDYVGLGGSRRKCKPCYNAAGKVVYQLKKENPYPYSNPVCDCCGITVNKDPLAIDHDHETKQFRGYLCRNCNTGLGALGDDIKGLERAMEYLRKHYDGQS